MKLFDIIKSKRMLKSAAALAALIAVAAAAQPGSAAMGMGSGKAKSETVYAVLENDGTYCGATVVNCFLEAGQVSDYGEYLSVKNLSGPEQPQIEGDKITCDAQASPFYYEGETQKKLPVSIGIKYYLSGEQKAPEDIAGQTGELRIEFTLSNETGTGEKDEQTEREVLIPLAASVSMTLDNDRFTVTDKPENSTCVLAGSRYTLSYASFPLPEDTFSFTVFGKEIALEPINIVVIPKAPPGLDSYGDFVDVDRIKDGADDMIEGADDMQSGVGDLLSALRDMKDAAKLLKDGMGELSGGAGDLKDGAGELYSKAKLLKSSAGEFYTGFSDFTAGVAQFNEGMGLLSDNISDMTAQLEGLAAAAAQLDAGVDDVGDGLEAIKALNDSIVADAAAGSSPLLAQLSTQKAMIDALVSGYPDLEMLSGSLSSGAQGFYGGFSTTFTTNVNGLAQGSAQLYTSCLELLGGANALYEGCAQISGALKHFSEGTGDLSDGVDEIFKKLPELIDGIDKMIDGVEDLEGGIGELNDDGLKELKSKFDGLEGYLDKLSAKAAGYGSFMDERNAAASTVQFVLKTKGIGRKAF